MSFAFDTVYNPDVPAASEMDELLSMVRTVMLLIHGVTKDADTVVL